MRGSATPAVDPAIVSEVLAVVTERTGLRADALRRDSVLSALDARIASGMTPAGVLGAIRAGDPEITAEVLRAATVPETYFFRQPDQFELVAHLQSLREDRVRGWSAACATGEEAYSLAAALRAGAHGEGHVQVLGTDLVEQNVATARAGVYRARSVRVSGPLLFPVFDDKGRAKPDGAFEVAAGLRRMTTFATHNLLDPAPAGDFDVIFCRNAILYLTPSSAAQVCENLARALAPDGILVFAPLDPVVLPRGLVSVGVPGAQVFARRESMQKIRLQMESGRHRVSAPALDAIATPDLAVAAAGAVATHTGVLECLEQGDIAGARRGLEALERIAPTYLPGMMERALWHRRRGEHARSRALVHDVLDQAVTLAPEAVVEGPEPLPAGFYVTSARTLLGGGGS